MTRTTNLRLNVIGTIVDGEQRHRGRVLTRRGRIVVRKGPTVLFEAQASSIDKLSKNRFSATLEDGRTVEIETEGCGCGNRGG